MRFFTPLALFLGLAAALPQGGPRQHRQEPADGPDAADSFIEAKTVDAAALMTVKIMPFGASIVGPYGCWRAFLLQKLQSNGITNMDMVGGVKATPDCGFSYDGDNEGHGGAQVTEYASRGDLVRYLAAATPHVILMHVGTNDILNGKTIPNIIAAYTTLVDQMRQSNPKMRIIISKLLPLDVDKFGAANAQRIKDLNDAIATWRPTKSQSQSPITIIDNWSGFDTKKDTIGDGEHPNESGNKKMADKFYTATVSAIKHTDGTWENTK